MIQATSVKRLCNTHNAITVNGQFLSSAWEVNNGDTLVVKVNNKAQYNITIHWHGFHQMRTGWADGSEFVTQCPIRPGESYTYCFTIQEQEATKLLGNLGWALMQQDDYIEAEDAYRRALSIAPDNNKMCNLGICLMKQGRIAEAKETLGRVKPVIADGPKGSNSHLKAYERAQQMLKDFESEMMNKGGDRIEQNRFFEAFLGFSSIWQPQPCKVPASFHFIAIIHTLNSPCKHQSEYEL